MSWQLPPSLPGTGYTHVRGVDGLHQMPAGDLIEHEGLEDCVCGPEALAMGSGTEHGWFYEHHALDGREAYERVWE